MEVESEVKSYLLVAKQISEGGNFLFSTAVALSLLKCMYCILFFALWD